MNNRELARKIIEEVGGSENIEQYTHCLTRLRLVLRNSSKANKIAIKDLDEVISVVEQGGQFQVVLGNRVNDVFDEVKGLLGSVSENTEHTTEAEKKSVFDQFTATISGIFTPAIGAMAATGMIKGLLAILSVTGLISEKSGTYIILYSMSNAFFYFMPIILGASTAKYFKLNSYVGMIIGASLIYPTLLPFATSGKLTFLSIPVNMMDYTSTVFPAIISVWLAAKLDKQVQKLPLKELRFMVQPLIVLLIIIPLALLIIGPVIATLSNIMAKIVNAVYHFSPVLGGIVIGGPWILLVMFGLHWAFIPIFVNNMAIQGFDPVMGLLLANQFAMAGAAIAVGVKTKVEKEKALAYSTGVTTFLGISEPALYGVLIPRKKPLIAAIIGGSVGGALAGLMNTVQYSFGGSGIFGIPLTINPKGIDMGFYGCILSQIVGFVVAFIVAFIWFNKGEKEENNEKITEVDIPVSEVLKGEFLSLSQLEDEVFSSGAMGKGIAVKPTEGVVYAPFDGKVTALLPSKHAIGLTNNQGVELLIHIGKDTVELNGNHFEAYVSLNQLVKKGDKLLSFDIDQLVSEGYTVTTPIVITNTAEYSAVTFEDGNIKIEV